MLDYRERKELRDYLEEQRLNRRLIVVRVLFALLFAACLAGFWYLQVVEGEQYRMQADSNRLRQEVIHPLRGNMFDRFGRPLVANRTAFSVVLNREQLEDPEGVTGEVAPLLGVEQPSLMERIQRYSKRPSFEPALLKQDVDLREIAALEARKYEIPAITVRTEARRYYPEGNSLAHVVGYVGEATEAQLAANPAMRLGDLIGKTGLEMSYDTVLRGEPGEQLVEVNSIGRPLGPVFVRTPPRPGQDLYLTLDIDLQNRMVEAFGDEVGAAVFLDPRNGEILALGSFPSFDPNMFVSEFSPEEWDSINSDLRHPMQNRALSSKYSPGSTFKLLVGLAALEAGVIDENTVINCPGSATFYGRRFGCWKKGGHGPMNLHSAIVHSCNVYFYTVGQRLGIEAIADYAARVGLGSPSGVDIPGERAGTVPSSEWSRRVRGEPWYPGETISVSIGQGPMEVTVLQMANLAAAIANGGPIYRPRIVRPGRGVPVTPEPIHTLALSDKTLTAIRKAMWGVVQETGTGQRARLPNISVLGKTGTVQVFQASAGVDSDDLPKNMRDHAWFVGYAPMEHPEIAFAVFVEHGGHGGTISAPIVRKVLELYFNRDRRPGLGPAPLEPEPGTEPPLVASATRDR